MARRKEEIHNRPLPVHPHCPADDSDPVDTTHLHPLAGEIPISITVDDLMTKSPWPSGLHFYA